MPKFRKKPVEIEAMQWKGNNIQEMKAFYPRSFCSPTRGNIMEIHTLEGVMTAQEGDYIIKGVQGEFYPCKPDIFAETYEAL
jgi:hypothetical protein